MFGAKQQAQHNTTQVQFVLLLCNNGGFFATNFQQMIPVPIPKIKKVSITMEAWIPGWAPESTCMQKGYWPIVNQLIYVDHLCLAYLQY